MEKMIPAIIGRKLFSEGANKESSVGQTPVAESPAKPKTLQDAFYAADVPPEKHGSQSSQAFFEDHNENDGIARFSPVPAINPGPQLDEYDRIALLLHASLERKKHRRRIHEYDYTFCGKDAVDWLVGTQVFPDAIDARNALRHLLNRRIIVRADHTRPILNDTVERFAPKFAQTRRVDLQNRYASPGRGFHDSHLYRFPAEAFSKTMLKIRVVRARKLRYRTRLHMGSFVLSSKFRNQRIDPYVKLEFGSVTSKTDTWSDGARDDPAWEAEFNFAIESNPLLGDVMMKDLWLRVFDFHDVLDDVELGFCLIPGDEILQNCAGGRVWTAWHVLKPASDLSDNHRTYGEIELNLSIDPFIAPNPLWTVFKEARSKEPGLLMDSEAYVGEMDNVIVNAMEKVGDFVNTMGVHVNKLVDKTRPDSKSNATDVDGAGTEEKTDEPSEPRYKLRFYRANIQLNLAEVRKDTLVWVDYFVGPANPAAPAYKGKSETKLWPVKDMGIAEVRNLTLDDLAAINQLSVLVKVYGKGAGLTVKLGEAVVPLKTFMPDLDTPINIESAEDINWGSYVKTEKLVLKRSAALKKNRKRIVGEMQLKGVIEPDNGDDGDDILLAQGDDDASNENFSNKLLEEDLLTASQMLSDNGFNVPDPLPNVIVRETIKDCGIHSLFWFIMSRNSPVLTTFAQRKGFKELQIGEWRWAGAKESRNSYAEDNPEVQGGASTPTNLASLPSTQVSVNESKPKDNAQDAEETSQQQEAGLKRPIPLVKQESLKNLEKAGTETLPQLPSSIPDTLDPVVVDTKKSDELSQRETENPSDASSAPDSPVKKLVTVDTSVMSKEPSKHLVSRKDESSSVGIDDYAVRTVTYIRPPESFVGELHVTESWRLKASVPDKGFWVEIEGTTDEPQYGKLMSTVIQIVGRYDSDTSSSITISCKVSWISRPTLAGIVERTAIPGMKSTYSEYFAIVKAATRKKKGGAGPEEVKEGGIAEANLADLRPVWFRRGMVWMLVVIITLFFALALHRTIVRWDEIQDTVSSWWNALTSDEL